MLRKKPLKPLLSGAALILGAAQHAYALTEMNDDSLSQVAGRDGLSVVMESQNMTANAVELRTDAGGFDIDGNMALSAAELALDATLQLDGVSIRSVDATGAVVGASPFSISQTLDAGSVSGDPWLSYNLDISRVRVQVDNMRVTSQPAVAGRSFGKWALDAPLSVDLRNRGGIFELAPYDGSGRTTGVAYVRGEVGRSDASGNVLEAANLFYRQAWHAHAYMTMHDFHAFWEMPAGTLGIDTDGIVWRTGYGGNWDAIPGARTLTESDLINLALDFEYLYKMPVHYGGGVGEDFVVTSNDRGLMHFGWLGSVKDAEVRWRSGGTWYGQIAGPGGIGAVYDVANKSGGLNLSASWDFVNRAEALALGDVNKEFRWQLGETSDVCPNGVCAVGQDRSRINFELSDWTLWGSRTSAANPGAYDYGDGLHTKPAASHFPLIAFDTINGSGQGTGGFCWGFAYNGPSATCSANDSQFINVQPGSIGQAYPAELEHLNANGGTAGGLAIHVRDGQLQSYSRRIRLLERDAAGAITTTNFNWGLIYSLANVDASFYLYPGGHTGDTGGGSRNYGVIADITLMSQSFDEDDPLHQGFNWEHGTHLMIADTDMNKNNITGETRDAQGVGFLSSSFLLVGNDTRIMVKNHWNANDFYEGGIDFTSPGSRFNYRATFGGGVLPDATGSYGVGPRIVQGALIDLNLEGAVNLRFSPSNPNDTWSPDQYTGIYNTASNYLGYSGALRLGELDSPSEGIGGDASSGQYGSYLVLAEPGRPDVVWRFANTRGDIAFTNGMIDLRGTNEDVDGKPKMVLANNMLIGAAAAARVNDGFGDMDLSSYSYGGPSGRELSANLMLGENTLGTAVIPSARIYSSITLTPQ